MSAFRRQLAVIANKSYSKIFAILHIFIHWIVVIKLPMENKMNHLITNTFSNMSYLVVSW